MFGGKSILLPPPLNRDPQLSEVGGRGHRAGGNGPIVPGSCGHLVGRQRMSNTHVDRRLPTG